MLLFPLTIMIAAVTPHLTIAGQIGLQRRSHDSALATARWNHSLNS
jgi:hypothetical protein